MKDYIIKNMPRIGLTATLVVAFVFPASSALATTTTASVARLPYQITSLSVEDKNDFVLEPGKMEVFLNPGETVTKYISVTSRIKQKTKFKVTTEDFVGSRSEQTPVILLGEDRSPYSFKDSLVPATSNFSLNFGERITLPVKITALPYAIPGGYYASVIVSNEPQVSDDLGQSAGARIISRVGILFFVRVNGDAKQGGYIEDFRINNPRFIYSESPESFEILFNNTGNTHLAPYGNIHISNTIGHEVANLPIDAYFAMPDSLRYRKIEWNDNKFRIGRYTAKVELHKGFGNEIDTRTTSFWIIPWMIILPLVIGIFLITLIAYLIVSKFELRRKK